MERPDIRERVVANLRNVDDDMAESIASRLGFTPMPTASPTATAPMRGLAPSDTLSILANNPTSFAGCKLGVLITDGASATAWNRLRRTFTKERATVEVIAPTITGVTLDDGTVLPAKQMIGGGPSVLYDAVAILASTAGATMLSTHPAAKDFVTDAHAHCKIVGFLSPARQLFDATGLTAVMDAGYIDLSTPKSATAMLDACRAGRFWTRAGTQ